MRGKAYHQILHMCSHMPSTNIRLSAFPTPPCGTRKNYVSGLSLWQIVGHCYHDHCHWFRTTALFPLEELIPIKFDKKNYDLSWLEESRIKV